jgi:hypothetical protein
MACVFRLGTRFGVFFSWFRGVLVLGPDSTAFLRLSYCHGGRGKAQNNLFVHNEGHNQNQGMPPNENSHAASEQLQNYLFWTSAQWNISSKVYSICHIAVNGIFPYRGMGRAEK